MSWFVSCLLLVLHIFAMRQIYGAPASPSQIDREMKLLRQWTPLKNESKIFFWRPQKVGSSTVLSLLLSYSYRYNLIIKRKGIANGMCLKALICLLNSNYSTQPEIANHVDLHKSRQYPYDSKEIRSEQLPYQVSLSHHLCNLPDHLVQASLACSFSRDPYTYMRQSSKAKNEQPIKELFIVRNPLSRIISIYYFWGELYRLKMATKVQWQSDVIEGAVKPVSSAASAVGSFLLGNKKSDETEPSQRKLSTDPALYDELNELNEYLADWLGDPDDLSRVLQGIHRGLAAKSKQLLRLGTVNSKDLQPIKGHLFSYHGNESSTPDLATALAFARKLPLLVGMPGPSFTWSGFSNSASEAEQIIMTDRIVTLVIERLDESLVVASHLLGWSLADMITVVNRKALSTHPKYSEWPPEAVQIMRQALASNGENRVYEAGNRKLDQRIETLSARGVNVTNEVYILQQMRQHASSICLQEEVLETYRLRLKQEGFDPHPSSNKLRDTDDIYFQKGHSLSFNGELLNSYDVCGNCEAHAWYMFHHSKHHSELKEILTNTTTTTSSDSNSTLYHHNRYHHYGSYLFRLPWKYRTNNIDFMKCPFSLHAK